jgi:hypothetical protein
MASLLDVCHPSKIGASPVTRIARLNRSDQRQAEVPIQVSVSFQATGSNNNNNIAKMNPYVGGKDGFRNVGSRGCSSEKVSSTEVDR